MTTHRLRAVTATLALGLAAGTAVVAASAASAAAPPLWQVLSATITGDLTGDGVADRLELAGRPGQDPPAVCGVQLRAGLGAGRFAAAVTYRLPVGDQGGECPELGVVVPAPTAGGKRLAVTYAYGTGLAQVFALADGRFALQSRLSLGATPNVLGSRDFDGDGTGDLWSLAGDGSVTFTAAVGRGSTWSRLYTTPLRGPAAPQFLDLDRDGGTDVLVNRRRYCDGSCSGSAVDVVNGRTGQVLTVARTAPDDPRVSTGSFLDADHDDFLDLEVTTVDADGRVLESRTFLNRSQDGRWSFRPVG